MVLGRPLTELLSTRKATSAAGRTGEALANLHSVQIRTDREWGMDGELDVIDRTLDNAVATRSDLEGAIETVRRAAHAIPGGFPLPKPREFTAISIPTRS